MLFVREPFANMYSNMLENDYVWVSRAPLPRLQQYAQDSLLLGSVEFDEFELSLNYYETNVLQCTTVQY